MADIVLTLNPLGNDPMTKEIWCGGWMSSNGKTHINVPTAWHTSDKSEGGDANGSIQLGSDLLDEYITANVGDADHLWVCGHSMGAQIIGRWFIKYGAACTVPTGDMTFIITGAPCSPQDMISTDFGGINWYKYPMTVNGTHGYPVIEIGREHDGWCRWDQHPNIMEFFQQIIGAFTVHREYAEVTLDASGHPTSYQATGTSGNFTWFTVDNS